MDAKKAREESSVPVQNAYIPNDQGSTHNAADVLTTLSQLVLIGGATILIFSLTFPEYVSRKLQDYKVRLTQNRLERMLEFMRNKRQYINSDEIVSDDIKLNDDVNFGLVSSLIRSRDKIYHQDIADHVQEILLKPPVVQFGIVTGPPGSGKVIVSCYEISL